MQMLGRSFSVVCLTSFAAPAMAHPHVSIDTGLEVIFDDQGLATGLHITWSYDEYISLLIAEDHGIDPDGDGNAMAEEDKALLGFDMNW